ncbi:tetratricopeptide repeat protein [candidate division TA06 bacterium]|uniref:Tetratricopeptide repeat protein n=1 Tax=candidate division TA06 bacterium TaxID=2250710 RepID=A0A523UXL7_UNCT6|nr:MAG: tetratricopeptide repeat protein [candidate division TA06 bacterium]
MNSYTHLRYLPFGLILLALGTASAQNGNENTIEPGNTYRFATHLFEEGEYLRAAIEYQRYIYSAPTMPTNADSVLYKIGLCYRMGGKPPAAINYFRKIHDEHPNSPLIEEAHYEIAFSYLLSGQGQKSMKYIGTHMRLIQDDQEVLKMQKLVGLNYLRLRKWDIASALMDSLGKLDPGNPLVISTAALAKEGQNLPHKNKALAGLYSSVIPGAGKVYCGRSTDGLFSLLMIGLTGWQAYEGFHKDGVRSVKGWVYGSIGGVLYLGNIYGSVVTAQIFNEEQEAKISLKVKVLINAQAH